MINNSKKLENNNDYCKYNKDVFPGSYFLYK